MTCLGNISVRRSCIWMGYPVNKQSSVRIWGRGDSTCFSMYPDGWELGYLLAKLTSAPLGMLKDLSFVFMISWLASNKSTSVIMSSCHHPLLRQQQYQERRSLLILNLAILVRLYAQFGLICLTYMYTLDSD